MVPVPLILVLASYVGEVWSGALCTQDVGVVVLIVPGLGDVPQARIRPYGPYLLGVTVPAALPYVNLASQECPF